MKITRDGKEYELTTTELETAYREQKYNYLAEDVRAKAEDMGIDLTGVDIDDITDRADNCLDRNDSYWESYWMSIEYALEDV